MKQKKIKLKCSQCKKGAGVNLVPYGEVGFRVDDAGRFVCWKHCKMIRWESDCCKSCSDRSFCSSEQKSEFKEFLDKEVEGV